MQLHRPDVLQEYLALDARLIVLSFASLQRLGEWVPHFQRNFLDPYYKEHAPSHRREQEPGTCDPRLARSHFVADPSLSVYHAYGLGRNSALKVYGAKILWQYAQWAIQGKPIQRSGEDTLQRGGDFVVGRDGRIALSYVGEDQSDRPSVTQILSALR